MQSVRVTDGDVASIGSSSTLSRQSHRGTVRELQVAGGNEDGIEVAGEMSSVLVEFRMLEQELDSHLLRRSVFDLFAMLGGRKTDAVDLDGINIGDGDGVEVDQSRHRGSGRSGLTLGGELLARERRGWVDGGGSRRWRWR